MLSVHEERVIASGMSGSPTLATDGTAIGAVSTGSMNPCLQHNLPGWYLDPDPAEVTNEPDPGPLADEANPGQPKRITPVESLRKPREEIGLIQRSNVAGGGLSATQFGLLLRRQSDGGIVGFAAATRQRPSLSRSTTPRLASRPSRMETALFSHWVAFAHWTTPASGWSRIASKSASSHAVDPTLGMKPRCRLDRERGVPRSARLGFDASVCSHRAI